MNAPMPVTTSEGLIATIGATSGTMFAANAGRTYLLIQNTHATQDLFVRFGGTAATTLLGLKIAAGASKEWPNTTAVPADAVQVIGSGSATTFYAVEGTGRRMQ